MARREQHCLGVFGWWLMVDLLTTLFVDDSEVHELARENGNTHFIVLCISTYLYQWKGQREVNEEVEHVPCSFLEEMDTLIYW